MSSNNSQGPSDVQKSLREAFKKTPQSFQDFVENTRSRLVNTPPNEWAITGAASLLLCIVYNAITKDKNESTLSFSVLFFASFLALSSIIVRPKKRENQYAWSVVIMSLVNVLFKSSGKLTPLFLAIYPPLINYVRDQAAK